MAKKQKFYIEIYTLPNKHISDVDMYKIIKANIPDSVITIHAIKDITYGDVE